MAVCNIKDATYALPYREKSWVGVQIKEKIDVEGKKKRKISRQIPAIAWYHTDRAGPSGRNHKVKSAKLYHVKIIYYVNIL